MPDFSVWISAPWSGYDAESPAVAVGVRKLGFVVPFLPTRKARLTEVN